jgi:hypothetical protein
MNGDIYPFPQYAFIAWCSVKRSTGTTLPLPLPLLYLYPINDLYVMAKRKVLLLPGIEPRSYRL